MTTPSIPPSRTPQRPPTVASRWSLRVAAAILGGSALLGATALSIFIITEWEEPFIAALGAAAVTGVAHSALALASALQWCRGRVPRLSIILILGLLASCALSLVLIWRTMIDPAHDLFSNSTSILIARLVASWLIITITTNFALRQISISSGLPATDTRQAVPRSMMLISIISIVLFALAALVGLAELWLIEQLDRALGPSQSEYGGTTIFALVMTSLIVSGIVAGRTKKTREQRPENETLQQGAALTFECPQCTASMQSIPGPVRCAHCGFTALIDLHEPRCLCGYLIYQLTAADCPECGRTIPEKLRWRGTPS